MRYYFLRSEGNKSANTFIAERVTKICFAYFQVIKYMNMSVAKKSTALLLLVSVLCIGSIGFANPAFAGNVTLKNPLCATGAGGTCVDTFELLITKITTFITQVIGALAVLMLVVAGIFFVLAGANPENVTKAKHIALYAIIGLAISLAGTGLVRVITAVIGPTPS